MQKKKWLGLLLNFLVPGLGNVYARNIKKGILHYVLFWPILFTIRFISYSFSLLLVALSIVLVYCIYVIITGYRDVQKDKAYEPAGFDKWYVYVLALILNATIAQLIIGKPLDRFTPINFASIPTPAMEPTLQVGDLLAFEKTKSITKNDVVIFWYPNDTTIMYVKRCIGIPGDSLQIKGADVFINGAPVPDILLKYSYKVITDGSSVNLAMLEKKHIDVGMLAEGVYQFSMTTEQANDFKKVNVFKSVERMLVSEDIPMPDIYPQSKNFRWNTDFFGPVYVPKKGDIIQLTESNIDLYRQCILFEAASVEEDSTGLIINGQPASTYQFTENYFFMMGDNRHNSADSRYWGFLPQRLVIGKAMYLYWGKTKDRIGKEIL